MPSLSSMPAFRTEGVVDSCRVSMVRLALIRRREPRGEGRGALPAESRGPATRESNLKSIASRFF